MNRHSPLPCTFSETSPAWSADQIMTDDAARVFCCVECDHDAGDPTGCTTNEPDDGDSARWVGPLPVL